MLKTERTVRLPAASPWHMVWIAVALSEALAVPMSLLFHGRILWDYLVTAGVLSGAASSVCAVFIKRLITGRERAESSLEESETFLRTVVETAPECVKLTDRQGMLLMMNRAGLAALDADSSEQVVGQCVYPFVVPEHRQAFMTVTDDVFKGQSRMLEFEIVGLKGTRRWMETHAAPLRNRQGDPVAVLAVTRDITARKRVEQVEAQLRQSQKMEAIGRLAGGIVHDFNNLMTVVRGYAEILLNRLTPGDPLRGKVEEIRKAGDRAVLLTEQLLAFSRGQVVRPVVLDLNDVVAGMRDMLRRLIGEEVEMVVVLASEPASVRADRGQLERVILNLAVNARDAMTRPSLSRSMDPRPVITIGTANVEVGGASATRHSAVPPGVYARLTVSDTGVGMDEETRARVFEPFFTTKPKNKGTGLGLATVHGIVQESGGSIFVDSESGRGTTFSIYLPRVEEAIKTGGRDAAPVGLSCGSETVLLVEDEDTVRALVRAALQDGGYTVLEARSSGEALRIGAEHHGPIHLLLADVVMPAMSGCQVAERLAASRPGMKTLYMSGYPDDVVMRHGLLRRAALLRKPFTLAALARQVRKVLDAAQFTGTGAH
ncbi:MAG: PAS domain S-box protein [Nitrospirae bacterium]|nr:PAS domain S-box protein [Nitrospirota bacterium]